MLHALDAEHTKNKYSILYWKSCNERIIIKNAKEVDNRDLLPSGGIMGYLLHADVIFLEQ